LVSLAAANHNLGTTPHQQGHITHVQRYQLAAPQHAEETEHQRTGVLMAGSGLAGMRRRLLI
jgi:hypothetical protein